MRHLTYAAVAARTSKQQILNGARVLRRRLINEGPSDLLAALTGSPDEVAVATLVASERSANYLTAIEEERFGQPIWNGAIDALKRTDLEEMTLEKLASMLDWIQFSVGGYQVETVVKMVEKATELDTTKLPESIGNAAAVSIALLQGQLSG